MPLGYWKPGAPISTASNTPSSQPLDCDPRLRRRQIRYDLPIRGIGPAGEDVRSQAPHAICEIKLRTAGLILITIARLLTALCCAERCAQPGPQFFIDIRRRPIRIGGCSAHPEGHLGHAPGDSQQLPLGPDGKKPGRGSSNDAIARLWTRQSVKGQARSRNIACIADSAAILMISQSDLDRRELTMSRRQLVRS